MERQDAPLPAAELLDEEEEYMFEESVEYRDDPPAEVRSQTTVALTPEWLARAYSIITHLDETKNTVTSSNRESLVRE